MSRERTPLQNFFSVNQYRQGEPSMGHYAAEPLPRQPEGNNKTSIRETEQVLTPDQEVMRYIHGLDDRAYDTFSEYQAACNELSWRAINEAFNDAAQQRNLKPWERAAQGLSGILAAISYSVECSSSANTPNPLVDDGQKAVIQQAALKLDRTVITSNERFCLFMTADHFMPGEPLDLSRPNNTSAPSAQPPTI